MHIHFSSADKTKTSYRLPGQKGKAISGIEVIGTSLEPFQFSNIHLQVAFFYSENRATRTTVSFTQAITKGWVPDQGMAIAPSKVIPDWSTQPTTPIEELEEVEISVTGSGDYNFTVDIVIDYVDMTVQS